MKLQSRAWLTSFGDLLTLLLCFIIAAVYQSAKQEEQKTELYQVDSTLNRTTAGQSEAAGKLIASKLVTEYPHGALSLLAADFIPSYAALSPSGVLKIKDFSEKTEGVLEMGICDVGFDFSETVFESLERQLNLRELRWIIGSKVCKNLEKFEKREREATILLTASVKQRHG